MWAVWGHFQGSSLCLTSSVCWFFRLTSSVELWGGGMLQTYSTVVCTVSQPRWTCPFSRRTAGNRLRPALGCVHLPGLSRSGSALR